MRKIALFLLCACLHANIIETKRMEDILAHVDESTWVIFDIDDTILESELHLGTAQWYRHEIKKLKDLGHDDATANDLTKDLIDRVREICPIRFPEPEVPSIIQQTQTNAGAVICLTCRYPHSHPITIKQFASLGIDFSSSAPDHVLFETKYPIHFENGIFSISPDNSKGEIFRRFLEVSNTKPTKVIFIDDTKQHLLKMEQEMEEMGIHCICFYYTKTHGRVFDPEIAEQEFRERVLR